MRHFIIGLTLFHHLGAVVDTKTGAGASTILYGDDLRTAGITRLSDIFILVPDWRPSSIDGHSWLYSPRGLSPLQNQKWSVYLNGHKVDLQWIDFNHLNMLPVSIDMIDKIELFTTPANVEGELQSDGAIHISTISPAQGFSVSGRFLLGNETGDTGPYRFTEFATTNVDRSASDGSFGLTWAREKLYVRGNVIVQHNPSSDVAILSRNQSRVNDWPGLHRSISPSITVGFALAGGAQEFLAALPTNRRYFYHSLPLAEERAINSALPQISVVGSFPISPLSEFHYRTSTSHFKMSQHPNTGQSESDWTRARSEGRIALVRRDRDATSRFGFGWLSEKREGDVPLDESEQLIVTATAALDRKFSRSVLSTITGTGIRSGKKYGIEGAVSMAVDRGEKWFLRATVAYLYSRPQMHPITWYRRFDLGSGAGQGGDRLSTDIRWAFPIGSRALVNLSIYHRYYSKLAWIDNSISLYPNDLSILSSPSIGAETSGHIVGGRFSIHNRQSTQISHKLVVTIQRPVSNDSTFVSGWQQSPQYLGYYQVIWQPRKSFLAWAMVRWSGKSQWSQYSHIDGIVYETDFRGNQVYNSTVPGFVIIDLKVRKLLAGGRLDANLLLRNILNQVVRYHPLGAAFGFTLLVEIGLSL